MYVISTAQTNESILIKLSTKDLTDICQCYFRGFSKFEFDDVMVAILHFCVAALSLSQFWSNFLQIWTQGTRVYAFAIKNQHTPTMFVSKFEENWTKIATMRVPQRENAKWPP